MRVSIIRERDGRYEIAGTFDPGARVAGVALTDPDVTLPQSGVGEGFRRRVDARAGETWWSSAVQDATCGYDGCDDPLDTDPAYVRWRGGRRVGFCSLCCLLYDEAGGEASNGGDSGSESAPEPQNVFAGSVDED